MTVPETTGKAQPSGQVEKSTKEPEGDNWQKLVVEFSATYDQIVARAGKLSTVKGEVLTGEDYQTAVLACILDASGRRSEVTRTQRLPLAGLNKESRTKLEQVVAEVIAGRSQRPSQTELTPSLSQPSIPDRLLSPRLVSETAQQPESMDLSKIRTWDAVQKTKVVDAFGNPIDTIVIQQQLVKALRANRSSLNNPTQYLNDNFPGLPKYLVKCLSRLCVLDKAGLGGSDATATVAQQSDAQPGLRSRRTILGESGPVTYDYSQLTTLADIITALRDDSSRVSSYPYVTNDKIARSLKVLFESSLTEARQTGNEPNTRHLSSELTNHGVTIDHPIRVAAERAFTDQVINRWKQEHLVQPGQIADQVQQKSPEPASLKGPIVLGKGEKDMKKNAQEVRLPNGVRMVFGSDEGANYKDHNEDGLVVDPQTGRVTVIDGMGGAGIKNAGMKATEIISQELARTRPADAVSLQNSLVSASRAIGEANLGGGGSTLMSVRAEQSNGNYDVRYSFCGDSGMVMIDANGKVAAYEGGHSAVGDMVKDGKIPEDAGLYHPMRNITGRAVDSSLQSEPQQIEHKKIELPKGSRLVIGSDGLTDNLTPEEIASIVEGKTAEKAYNDLVDVVKARMTNADDILSRTGKQMGTDWHSARESQGKFADGYRSQPKPDNLTIVVVDLP